MIVTLDSLSICGGNGEPFGPFSFEGGAPTHFQECDYRDCAYRGALWHQRDEQLARPGGDFPIAVELCYCCAAVPIRSGSRFSAFFCDGCRERVIALNKTYRFAAIPLGRHSIMHGFALSGADFKRPNAVEEFCAAVTSLSDRTKRLECWRRAVVRDHIDAMPDATDPYVPLPAYLEYVSLHAAPRAEMFRQLTVYFGVEADA